jgi:PAS domain S-box-containing protein
MNTAGKVAAQDQRYPAWMAISIGVVYSALITWAEAAKLFGIVDFLFFYLLGICVLGYVLNWRWAMALGLACAVMDGWWQHGRGGHFPNPGMIWPLISDLGIFALAAWLADRVRLQRDEQRELIAENAARKAALRELEATRERLALVLQHSPACLYAAGVTSPYQLTYVSENVRRLFGYEPADLLNSRAQWLDRVHTDDIARVHAFLAEFFAEGEASCEYRLRKKDGQYIWVLDHAKLLRDDKGNPIQAMGFITDINERKTALTTLEVQRDLAVSLSLREDLSAGLKSLLDVVLRMEGIDCCAIFLADEHATHFQLAVHAGFSDEFIEIISNPPPAGSPILDIIREGTPSFMSLPPTQLDNPAVALEKLGCQAIIPLQFQGRLLGLLNAASHKNSDIPEPTRHFLEALAAQAAGAISRIHTHEALQRSENRLKTIIDSTPVIVLAADLEGRITFEDGQALRTLHMEPGAHLDSFIWDLCQPSYRVRGYVQQVLQGEEFNAFIDIQKAPFDCWFSPERNAQGRIIGFFAIATNHSERQRLESQILDISDREQARIGQDIHDGLCQQLVSLAFDANALQTRIEEANLPAASLAERICSLLDAAITEARRLARGLFPIRLDADGLPSALEELALATTERFDLRCRYLQQGNPPVISQAQATHLYRIAQEAVTNAGKHARPKQVSIVLMSTSAGLELRIEDDGLGLTPDRIHQGMGLSIMDYRARSIGAKVSLSSNPGRGTTVSCCVPRQLG